jgi:hypothetical protein
MIMPVITYDQQLVTKKLRNTMAKYQLISLDYVKSDL